MLSQCQMTHHQCGMHILFFKDSMKISASKITHYMVAISYSVVLLYGYYPSIL